MKNRKTSSEKIRPPDSGPECLCRMHRVIDVNFVQYFLPLLVDSGKNGGIMTGLTAITCMIKNRRCYVADP